MCLIKALWYIYIYVCVCAFLMCVSGDHHNKNGFVTSKIWYIHINDRETLSWGTCMNFICTPWPSVINACKCNMIFWFFLTYYFQAIPSHLQMWLWLDKLCYLFFFRKGDFKRIPPPPPPPHTHTHTHTHNLFPTFMAIQYSNYTASRWEQMPCSCHSLSGLS